MTKHLTCVAIFLVACGGGGSGDDPDASSPAIDATVEPDAEQCPAGTPFTFYFNREGGTFTAGPDDPTTNVSQIVEADAPPTVAWAGDEANWAAILACAREAVADFDITIVDVEPAAGPYSEIVFTDTQLFQQGVFSVAPSTCVALEPHISFVFGSEFNSEAALGCQYAMFNLGIVTGLDISLDPCDFLTYQSSCTTGLEWVDTDAMCGAFNPALCRCDQAATQNSYQTLREVYGCPE